MTEWLKLERLEHNNLPLPKYETKHSAGIDFAACLTRQCKYIPPGETPKKAIPFICGSYANTNETITPPNTYNHNKPPLPSSYKILIHNNEKVIFCRYQTNDNWCKIHNNWKKPNTKKPQIAIMPNETIMIPLGFKTEFNNKYVLNIHVRSSIGISGLILANNTGIIDPDYRGELYAPIYNRNTTPIIIEHGQRIIQGILLYHNQAIIIEEKVNTTKRGENGFGSTDNNPTTHEHTEKENTATHHLNNSTQ